MHAAHLVKASYLFFPSFHLLFNACKVLGLQKSEWPFLLVSNFAPGSLQSTSLLGLF